MGEIVKLHYSTRISLREGENVLAEVHVGNDAVFSSAEESWDAGQAAINAYVKSQGWVTFTEWNAKYPLRYKMWVDEDDNYGSTFSDQVCTDRLTGNEIFRYDLGDPANWSADYGGISNDERFERRKLDQYERVCVEDCSVKD